MLFNTLLAVGSVLPAAMLMVPTVAASLELSNSYPIPDFKLGTATTSKTADVDSANPISIYCGLQPAKKCLLEDAYEAYEYLSELGYEGTDCGITGLFTNAETAILMVVEGTASVQMSSKKLGNVTMSCTTTANLLSAIIGACQTGEKVKGLIQVPASDYTSQGFKADDHTVAIFIEQY